MNRSVLSVPLQERLSAFNPGARIGKTLEDFRELYSQIEAQLSSIPEPPQVKTSPYDFFDEEDLSFMNLHIEQQVRQPARKPRSDASALAPAPSATNAEHRSKENKRLQHLHGLCKSPWQLQAYNIFIDFGLSALHSTGYLAGLRRLAAANIAPYETVREVLAEVRERRIRGTGGGVNRRIPCASCDIDAASQILQERFPLHAVGTQTSPSKKRGRELNEAAQDNMQTGDEAEHDDADDEEDAEEDTEEDEEEEEVEFGRPYKKARLGDFNPETSYPSPSSMASEEYADGQEAVILDLPNLPNGPDSDSGSDCPGLDIAEAVGMEATELQHDDDFLEHLVGGDGKLGDCMSEQPLPNALVAADIDVDKTHESLSHGFDAAHPVDLTRSDGAEPLHHNGDVQTAALDILNSDTKWLSTEAVYASVSAFNPAPTEYDVVDPVLLDGCGKVGKVATNGKLIIILNHGNSHWTFACADWDTRNVFLYDSMRGNGSPYSSQTRLDAFLARVRLDAAQDSSAVKNDLKPWKYRQCGGAPQQTDDINCGIFAAAFAIFEMHDYKFPATIEPKVWRRVFAATLSSLPINGLNISAENSGDLDAEAISTKMDRAKGEIRELQLLKDLAARTSSRLANARCRLDEHLREICASLKSLGPQQEDISRLLQPMKDFKREVKMNKLVAEIEAQSALFEQDRQMLLTTLQQLEQREQQRHKQELQRFSQVRDKLLQL